MARSAGSAGAVVPEFLAIRGEEEFEELEGEIRVRSAPEHGDGIDADRGAGFRHDELHAGGSVGLPRQFDTPDVDPGVRSAVDQAVSVLVEQGAQPVDVDPAPAPLQVA